MGDNDPTHHQRYPRDRRGHAQYPIANSQPWYDYRTSVDQIEAVTGLDFFNALPVTLQAALESGVDTGEVH
ncbi:MAG: hypothetical protein WBB32_01215 [Flavobacteriales bacterium]